MLGTAGDCLSLIEILEEHLQKHPQLIQACISFVRDWRKQKVLRQLSASLCVADKETTLLVSGNGDVMEQEGGIMAIGSGGDYAYAAARALIDIDNLEALDIAKKSMYFNIRSLIIGTLLRICVSIQTVTLKSVN